MFMWFSKKKRKEKEAQPPKLPEPLEFPELPELEAAKKEKEKIPGFISPPLPKKEEIGEIRTREIPELRSLPKLPELKKTEKLGKPPIEATEETEPIFVRIDNFQKAKNDLEKIREQLNGIQNLLDEAKELQAKEQKELAKWETNLMDIKARLESIDKRIFNKIN